MRFCPCELSAAEECISLCAPESPSQIRTSSFQPEDFTKKRCCALSVFAEEVDDVSTGGDV